MDYEYWTKTINEEDRKINNANRRFRYHCYSLESMSEELIYKNVLYFPTTTLPQNYLTRTLLILSKMKN